MVRPAETIRQDIDSLTTATTALAAEFRRLYVHYLESLGGAVRRQVVMATYHLCTQVYPENFLALSVSQRETLQREVRRLGQLGQAKLQQLLDDPVSLSGPADEAMRPLRPSLPAGVQAKLRFLPGEASADPTANPTADGPLEPASDARKPDLTDPDTRDRPPADPQADADLSSSEPWELDPQTVETTPDEDEVPLPSILKSMVMAALAEEMAETFGDPLFTGEPMTPTRLAKQHIFLEQQIRTVLQHISKQVNQRLQAAQVIPNLPEAILDAASETEVGPMRGRAVPNVLSVLVAMAESMEGATEDSPSDEDRGADRERFGPRGPREDRNSLDSPDLDYEEEDADEEDADEEDMREGLMTHLAAVNLRLADLEFGSVHCSLGRSKLRASLGRLRKLGKQYQKVQRELAIAEAEQAWRAVWYDES